MVCPFRYNSGKCCFLYLGPLFSLIPVILHHFFYLFIVFTSFTRQIEGINEHFHTHRESTICGHMRIQMSIDRQSYKMNEYRICYTVQRDIMDLFSLYFPKYEFKQMILKCIGPKGRKEEIVESMNELISQQYNRNVPHIWIHIHVPPHTAAFHSFPFWFALETVESVQNRCHIHKCGVTYTWCPNSLLAILLYFFYVKFKMFVN